MTTWTHRGQNVSPATTETLRKDLSLYPEPIADVLAARGITTFEEAHTFMHPKIDQVLHDPFLLLNMEAAVARIKTALSTKQTILVYGDYDVDGTTSTAILVSSLRKLGNAVRYYIPDRKYDGYGFTMRSAELARLAEADLVIAVDCGTTSIKPAQALKNWGIDLIIVDHHTPEYQLPEAILINPKQPLCTYPNKDLTACGLVYKLVCALNRDLDIVMLPGEHLDLVALSTIADVVDVTGENHALASAGLFLIRTKPSPGLEELIRSAGLSPHTCTSTDLAYAICPRINAAGRIGDASLVVPLFLADSRKDAHTIAFTLQSLNNTRKALEKEAMEQAHQLLDANPDIKYQPIIVIHHAKWHVGILGIIASRIAEHYSKPSIALSNASGDTVVGSARSYNAYNILNAITAASGALSRYGGHAYAAGLSLARADINAFRLLINQYADLQPPDTSAPDLLYDTTIPITAANPVLHAALTQLEPYGPGNPQPVFVSRKVPLLDPPDIVGEGHLKLVLDTGDIPTQAIAWRAPHLISIAREAHLSQTPLDIAYTIEMNTFRNRRSLQLNIKDLAISQT